MGDNHDAELVVRITLREPPWLMGKIQACTEQLQECERSLKELAGAIERSFKLKIEAMGPPGVRLPKGNGADKDAGPGG